MQEDDVQVLTHPLYSPSSLVLCCVSVFCDTTGCLELGFGKGNLVSEAGVLFVFGFGLGVSSGPHQIDLAVSVSLVENDCLGGLQTVKNTETLKKETPVGRAGRIFFSWNLGRIYDSFSLYPRRPDSFLAKESTTSQNNTSFFGPLLFSPRLPHTQPS